MNNCKNINKKKIVDYNKDEYEVNNYKKELNQFKNNIKEYDNKFKERIKEYDNKFNERLKEYENRFNESLNNLNERLNEIRLRLQSLDYSCLNNEVVNSHKQLEEIELKEQINNINEQNCIICLENYMIGDKICYLPCSHYYHAPCIKMWLKTSCRCPLCNNSI